MGTLMPAPYPFFFWTLLKGSLRPSITPGGPFRSWHRTDRSGVHLLLPYMPAGITGISEWKSEPVPYPCFSGHYWKLYLTHFAQKSSDVYLSNPWVPMSLCPHILTSLSPQVHVAHIPEFHVPETGSRPSQVHTSPSSVYTFPSTRLQVHTSRALTFVPVPMFQCQSHF